MNLKMNFIITHKLFSASVIFFIVKFNYLVLGQNNSDSSNDGNSNDTDRIGTYRSIPEYFIENLMATVDSGANSSSIITRTFSELLEAFADEFTLVFPGTEWCGNGDDAPDANDLGYFDETDYCCRNHDNCPGSLVAGKSIGDLINNGLFTRSTCNCDHALYKCLREVNSTVSNAIGDTYFNLLRPQCYTDDYQPVSCIKNDSVRPINKKCVEYVIDTSENRTLQWIDNPDY